ncbi:MAG: hypothetical protein M0013_02990 [Actinomycetota bacterium]|nr:hypothetical protein [Actinomycetota bacterium]
MRGAFGWLLCAFGEEGVGTGEQLGVDDRLVFAGVVLAAPGDLADVGRVLEDGEHRLVGEQPSGFGAVTRGVEAGGDLVAAGEVVYVGVEDAAHDGGTCQ